VAELNITNIPAPRVPFVDERTGLMAREWYRFFLNLFVLTGSGNNPITLEELQLGPPNQPDLTELLIQINQNIAPQYEDQSGDFLATLDTAQLMSMMSRFENAEAAIQGAYLQPVVQTGTIANYNLDGSPTAGGIAYGTGPALAVSAAGTTGQVLTSATAGTPTWTTPTTGTVTSVAALTLGTTGTDLSSTVANPTTTPVITLQVPTASAANRGALSAADWTTFNNKGSGTVTSVTGTAPVVSSGGTTPAISMAAATTSVNGYLTSTDWNTFNGKGSGSVTSVAQSFTGGLISVAGSPITSSGTLALTVAGTSGGIPYFSSTSTWASSAALAAGSLVLGGGSGVTPATTATGTGVVTALGVNTGTAGAFVVNGGALGTPSSGTVTNLTGTASININGTVGATTAAAGKFTTLGVTALITSTLTSGEVMKFGSPSAGTGIIYMDMFNTSGGLYLGIEGSAGGVLWTNIPAYATGLGGRTSGGGISFSANAVTQHMLLTTTGLAITGTLSATGVVTFSNYGVGTATFNGSGVISSVSDETWKIKDGAPANPDAMLKQLEPGYWYYNDEKKDTFGKDRQLGFYAQNVNAAIGPEAAPEPESYIRQDEDGNEITVKKPWGYYDRSVLAVTVLSLQKALANIESLTARIAALEAK
jgi:hypothetical protein